MPDQQVQVQTHDAGTQTNGIDHRTTTVSQPDLMLDSQGEDDQAHVAFPEDNRSPRLESLALTLFLSSQHNDLDLEQLTVDQGQQDVFLGDHASTLEEIHQENIRLRSQRDDLLGQRAALENDLTTSFIEKMDLVNQLSNAEKTIEKGRAYYETLKDEWKRDHGKLQDMTRLFEANTENERYIEMLRQQELLEEKNTWLLGQLQMKTEDNRFFACQREAVVQASSYDRVCAMSSEIQLLRQWLSTVQAQLADSDKAKNSLEEELQQERLKHRATRNAFELKAKMASSTSNVQQSANAGGSGPQKPSKFTSTFPTAFQAPLPKARTPPPFSSEQKSESIFGADPFFDPCAASSNIPQHYGTRSKSKFSFGDSAVPESTSSPTKTTTGAKPPTDFNFTFGGPSAYDNTTGLSLPKDWTCAAKTAVASPFSADPKQTTSASSPNNSKMPLTEAETQQPSNESDHGKDGEENEHLAPKTTAENQFPHNNFAKSANLYINLKTKKGARKPLASDFFDEDPVKAEVETNSIDTLVAEKVSEESVPIISAGADVSQQVHISSGTENSATAKGSVQAGGDNETKGCKRDTIPLSPTPTTEPSPPSSKSLSKQPKNKAKTTRRTFLRKVAKERKRAAIGEADWSETS